MTRTQHLPSPQQLGAWRDFGRMAAEGIATSILITHSDAQWTKRSFCPPNSHWKRSSCKMVNTTITFGKSARVTWLNCFILFMCVGSQQEVNQSTEKRKKNSRIMGNIVFIVSCNLTHFRHWDISACQTWQWHLEKELRAVSSQIDPYVCPE